MVAGALFLLLCATVTAQPVAVIEIEAFSPQEIDELGWTSRPSNGLSVVGSGELVYLFGSEASGAEVTGFSWSVVTAPFGSTATLDSTNTQRTTFVPDAIGDFDIQLSITTSEGTADAVVRITSSQYIGKELCTICHPTAAAGWQATGHATKLQRDLSGETTTFYQERCIACHSVGYDTLAENGGFDDIQAQTGWVLPDSLHPDVWADMVNNYPALVNVSNVQCENCHGSGSVHAGSRGDKTKINVTLDEGLCGKCHEDEPYHTKNLQWKKSGHSIGVASGADRQPCAGCHSGYGFVNRIDDEVDRGHSVTTGSPQISCAVCHDPHSTNHANQLRNVADVTLTHGVVVTFGEKGRFCMSCHISRRNADTYVEEYQSHFGPHESNQTDMLAGTNAITFGKQVTNGHHKDILSNACIDCHMWVTPEEGQPGHNRMGEHSFAMHDPLDGVDNVAACAPCHNITSFDEFPASTDHDGDGTTETARAELQGLLDEVGKRLPPYGDPAVVVDTTQFPLSHYTPTVLRAAYNHAFITDDGSMGMHNYKFAVSLMKVTLDTLQNDPTVAVASPQANIPTAFALNQNYPNPFNPTTKIHFDVPVAGHVKIEIYNSIGQPIVTLVDEKLAAKSYVKEWDARGHASGLYFYVMRADGFVDTKKMLLLK